MRTDTPVKIYILLFSVILIWGISWPINKIGLQYVSPLWFAAMRLSVGAVTMFIVVFALKKLKIPTRKDIPLLLVIGVLQVAIFMLCINVGLKHVNAGRSAILVYTTPLWVMPLAILFFKEKASLGKWLGFFLGIGGILILFNPAEIDWSSHEVWLGNGILLGASFVWAISMLCTRNMHWHHSPLQLIPWQLAIGAILLWIYAFSMDSFNLLTWHLHSIEAVIFTGVFATAFAYWGAIVISKELPSITASLSFLGVPVCGLIFAAFILGEPITPSILLAMLAILAGIACVALSGKRSKTPKIDVRID